MTKISLPQTLIEQILDGAFTQTLDGAQAIDDLAGVVDHETEASAVDVGLQHGQSHAPALFDHGYDLVRVLHVGRQYRRHEVGRVKTLQPGRLV